VYVVIDRTPKLLDRVVGLNVLDAMIWRCSRSRARRCCTTTTCTCWAVSTSRRGFSTRADDTGASTASRSSSTRCRRSTFKTVKPVEILSRATGRRGMNLVEKVIAYSPPFVYSHVTGIESPTGEEAEAGSSPSAAHRSSCWRTAPSSPIAACSRLGAWREARRPDHGPGAFTKVVGDAGVTVAKRADIPITTGNSYSASAALWAGADAARRIGLVPLDNRGKVKGKAMVIGATGAIGSACTRLLAQAVEEVHLVSIEMAKLLTLKESILKDTPTRSCTSRAAPGMSWPRWT